MDYTQQAVAQANTYTVVMRYEMACTMQVKGENEQAAEAEAFTEFHQGNPIPESEFVAGSLKIREITLDKVELPPQQRSFIIEEIEQMKNKIRDLEKMIL